MTFGETTPAHWFFFITGIALGYLPAMGFYVSRIHKLIHLLHHIDWLHIEKAREVIRKENRHDKSVIVQDMSNYLDQ